MFTFAFYLHVSKLKLKTKQDNHISAPLLSLYNENTIFFNEKKLIQELQSLIMALKDKITVCWLPPRKAKFEENMNLCSI